MRSTFAGLNTMVRGIYANQLALDTTGHNITNASTEGYSRQSVNLAATQAQAVDSVYGQVMVGTGVDSTSIERARNVYADKQYWSETATKQYYATEQTNYDKVEAIFDDADNTGILNAMNEFYNAWDDLSTHASTSSNRVSVIEKGNVLADKLQTSAQQLQDQIKAQYDEMTTNVQQINSYTDQIVKLNKNIMQTEATGAKANDLRDQRDEIVDKLSSFMNLNVYEDSNGMYAVVSNGISLVNGTTKLTLEMSQPFQNDKYGISDYSVNIKESGIAFIPQNGSMKAQMDTIAEDKGYLDKVSNIAGFLLTTFNTVHQQGAGIDGTDSSFKSDSAGKTFGIWNSRGSTYAGPTYGINFWGDRNTIYTWDAEHQQVVAKSYAGGITRSVTIGTKKDQDGNEVKDADGNAIQQPVVDLTGNGTAKTENLEGINIIKALQINTQITATGGQNLIAARKFSIEAATDKNGKYTGADAVTVDGSGDGTNATNIKGLMNMDRDYTFANASSTVTYGGQDQTNLKTRSIKDISLNSYYTSLTSQLGSDSESVDDKADAQDELLLQITNWRSSTSGVDWNEELTNMIMFQKGYSACSRCLTTMDEMLDKLINSTGMVGR
jgi:flagellar hook-associated protein 1 FlgK